MDCFVVGTGRCGSTLLSKMLAASPEMLSIFEFFNGLPGDRRLGDAPISAAALWDLLATPHPFVTMVTSRGFPVEEVAYPFGEPGMRFRADDDVPWLLVATLPRLDRDPDRLFDELREEVLRQPARAPAAHYRHVFGWLAARYGKTRWNERSGSSIDLLPELARAFPDARFLHIHRRGEEAALSMREHHAFRLAISIVYGLDPEVDLATALAHPRPAPGRDDPVRRMLERRPAAEHFGRFWSQQLAVGYRGVAELPSDRYREVRFEDLVARPAATLREIAEFFALDAARDRWIERAASLVRAVPPPRARTLPDDERARLVEACRPGNRLLGRSG
jgi:hypothetical protein